MSYHKVTVYLSNGDLNNNADDLGCVVRACACTPRRVQYNTSLFTEIGIADNINYKCKKLNSLN